MPANPRCVINEGSSFIRAQGCQDAFVGLTSIVRLTLKIGKGALEEIQKIYDQSKLAFDSLKGSVIQKINACKGSVIIIATYINDDIIGPSIENFKSRFSKPTEYSYKAHCNNYEQEDVYTKIEDLNSLKYNWK